MFKRLLLATAVATFPVAALVSVPGESPTRSVRADPPTALIFSNEAHSPEDAISVCWLDYDGNRQPSFDLYPAETRRHDTCLTHPRLISFPVPGGGEDCYGIVQPLAQTGRIVIR